MALHYYRSRLITKHGVLGDNAGHGGVYTNILNVRGSEWFKEKITLLLELLLRSMIFSAERFEVRPRGIFHLLKSQLYTLQYAFYIVLSIHFGALVKSWRVAKSKAYRTHLLTVEYIFLGVTIKVRAYSE